VSYDLAIRGHEFNYTYNMSDFFRKFGVHPIEHLNGASAEDVVFLINEALELMGMWDPIELSDAYDSHNGWGSVETAIDWLVRIRDVCEAPDVVVVT
jgi:hypothetical protein